MSVEEQIEWIGRSRQCVGYVNSLGISTHPQCYCVCMYRKRATAEECLKHPWLNSLPHPHSHPHLHTTTASSLDEPETSQSESEPESPAPSPELDLLGSYLMCPGQGELKTGRDAFSFSEPPFPTRPEIQQELICWMMFHRDWRNSNSLEQTLKASEPAASWPQLRAMLYGCCMSAASTAVISVGWAACSLIPLRVCVYNTCYTMLIWLHGRNVRGMQENEVGRRYARIALQHCTAALKVTELNLAQLNCG